MHGISFSVCILACVPVKVTLLERIAWECLFVNLEVKDMAPNHMRFLYCYYYATSMYQFHGKSNRVDLPNCIVRGICEMYQDED